MNTWVRFIKAMEQVHAPSAETVKAFKDKYRKFYHGRDQYKDMPPSKVLERLFYWDGVEPGWVHWAEVHESLVELENAELSEV